MTTSMPIDLKCPCCDESFQSQVLTSTNTFGGTTSDLHQLSAGFDPLAFMISSCPTCGFSGSSDAFKTTISDELRNHVLTELQPITQSEGGANFARQYSFAAKIAEWEDKPPYVIAHRYMQAAWCCESFNQCAHEDEYRGMANQFFEVALNDQSVPEGQQFAYMYLIGENFRRMGEIDEAHRWFEIVIDNAASAIDNVEAQNFAQLAQQQRDDPQHML